MRARHWKASRESEDGRPACGRQDYEHALGHQVGRLPHNGGALLAPRWERPGEMLYGQLRPGEVYTLEPTIITPEGWVCQVEQEVLITLAAPLVLTHRALDIGCV